MKKLITTLVSVVLAMTVLTACGGKNSEAPSGSEGSSKDAITVRLGVFKNITHAPSYVALDKGYFQKEFGDNVKIEVLSFDNGSEFSTALATGEIDIGTVGPGPSTNQYVKSKNFRVVSGSNNGGAVLVVGKDSGITDVKELVGKTVAIPTKGSTNEISLRLLLQQAGLKVTDDSTGVQIIARAPADTLIAMRQKEIDATLIPEPWGTQMEQEGIGSILVDWNKIPPNNGDYPLSIMVASDKFIKEHRDLVKAAIKANLQAIDFIEKSPDEAYASINNQLKELTGKAMDVELIKAALARCHITSDVSKEAIEEMAKVSIEAGYIKDITVDTLDLSEFVDLSMLEEVKTEK
ncbi:NitT/TauT family transport system substrate-binding protein [Paenibacillaceae bacterium GAS479]|nr:NitT/TauT family transport system substrate-binding protein [Paenibacillaceae bacterium GAS479]